MGRSSPSLIQMRGVLQLLAAREELKRHYAGSCYVPGSIHASVVFDGESGHLNQKLLGLGKTSKNIKSSQVPTLSPIIMVQWKIAVFER